MQKNGTPFPRPRAVKPESPISDLQLFEVMGWMSSIQPQWFLTCKKEESNYKRSQRCVIHHHAWYNVMISAATMPASVILNLFNTTVGIQILVIQTWNSRNNPQTVYKNSNSRSWFVESRLPQPQNNNNISAADKECAPHFAGSGRGQIRRQFNIILCRSVRIEVAIRRSKQILERREHKLSSRKIIHLHALFIGKTSSLSKNLIILICI